MKRSLVAACWKQLITSVRHPDPVVRSEGARLLGLLGDRRAVPGLIRMLRETEYYSKITAVYALGQIGDRRATPVLREISDEPRVHNFASKYNHDMFRLAAARELAIWNDDSGVQNVRDLLRLPELEAMLLLGPAILAAPQTAAMEPLRNYVTLPFVMWWDERDVRASTHFRVAQCLAFFRSPKAHRKLEAYLEHYSRYVRSEAARSLLARGVSQSTWNRIVRAAHREKTPFGRLQFARILHGHRKMDARKTVAQALRDRDYFVRATAMDAAAELRLTDLVHSIKRSLSHDHFYVRLCAIEALEKIGDERTDAVVQAMLRDPHPRVSLQAAQYVYTRSRQKVSGSS